MENGFVPRWTVPYYRRGVGSIAALLASEMGEATQEYLFKIFVYMKN